MNRRGVLSALLGASALPAAALAAPPAPIFEVEVTDAADRRRGYKRYALARSSSLELSHDGGRTWRRLGDIKEMPIKVGTLWR